jgi:hypothetical protein
MTDKMLLKQLKNHHLIRKCQIQLQIFRFKEELEVVIKCLWAKKLGHKKFKIICIQMSTKIKIIIHKI